MVDQLQRAGPVVPGHRQGDSFSDMLVREGIASQEQMAQAKDAARREGVRLSRVLVRDGLVLSRDLAALIALHQGLTMLDLRSQTIDPQASALLPEFIAGSLRCTEWLRR